MNKVILILIMIAVRGSAIVTLVGIITLRALFRGILVILAEFVPLGIYFVVCLR